MLLCSATVLRRSVDLRGAERAWGGNSALAGDGVRIWEAYTLRGREAPRPEGRGVHSRREERQALAANVPRSVFLNRAPLPFVAISRVIAE